MNFHFYSPTGGEIKKKAWARTIHAWLCVCDNLRLTLLLFVHQHWDKICFAFSPFWYHSSEQNKPKKKNMISFLHSGGCMCVCVGIMDPSASPCATSLVVTLPPFAPDFGATHTNTHTHTAGLSDSWNPLLVRTDWIGGLSGGLARPATTGPHSHFRWTRLQKRDFRACGKRSWS